MKKERVFTLSFLLLAAMVCLLSQPGRAGVSMVNEETFDTCGDFHFCFGLTVVDGVLVFEPVDSPPTDQLCPEGPFCGFNGMIGDGDVSPLFLYQAIMEHLYQHIMDVPDFPFEACPDLSWLNLGDGDCGSGVFGGIVFPFLWMYQCPNPEPNPIPEPATLALLGLGGLLLRRKK